MASITSCSITLSTMANANRETHTIIQPLFGKLEEYLDLNAIIGKLFSKEIFGIHHMQMLQTLKGIRIEQNRTFLMHLITQPVQQLKAFCHVLQEDVGNASHRELAAEILDVIPPDPMEVNSGVTDITPVCRDVLSTCQSMDW